MKLSKIVFAFLCFLFLFFKPLLGEEILHTVKKGETLEKIARKYGVTEKELKEWNNLKSNRVISGQKLVIKQKKDEPKERYHIVKKGESLAQIAKLYGVTVKEIEEWNNLKNRSVKPGQKLVIKTKRKEEERPSKEQAKEPQPKGESKRDKEIIYRVKAGETLSQIAQLFGIKEEDIIEANNLKSRELKAGQRLLIRLPSERENKAKVEPKETKQANTVSELFQQIQKKEENLKRGNPTRQDYISLIAEYRRIYLMYPASEEAPLALFKTAELYQEIYLRSLKKADLLEAAKRFELFLKNYPQHPRAENAYLRLSNIYKELKEEEKLKNLEKEWGARFPKAKSFLGKEVTKDNKGIGKGATSKEEKGKEDKGKEDKAKEEKFIVADLKKVLKIEPVTGADYTRIIVDVSGNFEYQANILPGGKEAPPRLYVDIYPAVLDDKLQRAIDLQDLHLERVRVGQYDRQTVRVVLDFKSLTDYKLFKLREPYQLIIDLHGKEKAKPQKVAKNVLTRKESRKQAREVREEALPKTKQEEKKEEYINLARQFGLGVKRIVIDPGHGGEDPGALGPNGLKEKDVVLKIAKLLGRKLEERLGVEIIYTRSTDVFIPLAKRPAIANSQKADLFVSIHLNAAPDPQARGIETYYLNFTTDPEAMRVAALENRVNDKGLADLQDLVKAILANTKLKESRLLAERVQRELVRTLSRHYPDIEDRGVKYAPFLVLVGTRMPAILVEASFISNPTCAERLTKEDYLEKIAEGIARGIESYIQSLKLSGSPSLDKS